MSPRAEPLLSVQEQAQEGGLQEEGEHAFHGQSLADHASGKAREVRPVRAELKFHGDAGHHTQHEVNAENPGPEARRLVISLIITAQAQRFKYNDERGQPHGELGEQIMEGDGKGEVKAMN